MCLKRVVLLLTVVVIWAVVAFTFSASAGLLPPAHKQVPKRSGCEAPISGMKPGMCPKYILAIACTTCNDHCKSDYDCPGNSKCCSQPSCGNRCVTPVYKK